MQITILMPCLNEAETLANCIENARLGLQRVNLEGEILIADNGSTDGSVGIAQRLGARVIQVEQMGYGSALRGGIAAARGDWIIMADADVAMIFPRLRRLWRNFARDMI